MDAIWTRCPGARGRRVAANPAAKTTAMSDSASVDETPKRRDFRPVSEGTMLRVSSDGLRPGASSVVSIREDEGEDPLEVFPLFLRFGFGILCFPGAVS